VLVFAGLVGVAVFNLFRGNLSVALSLLAVACGLSLVGFLSVRGYDVDQGRLIIERLGWRTVIDLSDLTEAEEVPKLVRSSISLWSTRGLFGFIGYGYTTRFGTYRAYVTNPGTAVLLRFLSGRIIVVSPESPNEFVTAVAGESKFLAGTKSSKP
jgi:hypothetical protein